METRGDFLTRTVRDTLDSIVSHAVRDSLLAEALGEFGVTQVPDDPVLFQEFLHGPLARSLGQALGQELGESVVKEIERVVAGPARESLSATATARRGRKRVPAQPSSEPARRSSAPAPRSREARTIVEREGPAARGPSSTPRPPSSGSQREPSSTPRAPISASQRGPASSPRDDLGRMPTLPMIQTTSDPRPPASGDYPSGTAAALGMVSGPPDGTQAAGLPVVFVATRNSDLVRRFGAWLDSRAIVLRASRLVELLLNLEDGGRRRTVIVLDCQQPSLRPQTLAAIAEEMPSAVRVVLWGASRDLEASLTQISPRVSEWVYCPSEVEARQVMERCVELVG